MKIPFQSSGLSKELKIHKKLVHAINIQCKGMELVSIITKCHNIEVININCNST